MLQVCNITYNPFPMQTSTRDIVEHMPENSNVSVAVLLPCYNEEVTIGKVIRDFKTSLPQADIYVYDNNSTDRTAEIAASEGAIVRKEPRQGKGNVIPSHVRRYRR